MKYVDGVGQADQEGREDGRADLGQDDLEERLFGVAPQVQRRLVQVDVQLAQLGA